MKMYRAFSKFFMFYQNFGICSLRQMVMIQKKRIKIILYFLYCVYLFYFFYPFFTFYLFCVSFFVFLTILYLSLPFPFLTIVFLFLQDFHIFIIFFYVLLTLSKTQDLHAVQKNPHNFYQLLILYTLIRFILSFHCFFLYCQQAYLINIPLPITIMQLPYPNTSNQLDLNEIQEYILFQLTFFLIILNVSLLKVFFLLPLFFLISLFPFIPFTILAQCFSLNLYARSFY